MATTQAPGSSTADRILDVAERLVQTRGFNGFSYANIAAELSITKASLHYHYTSKAELGAALIARYAARFIQALAEIDTGVAGAPAKLDAYADLYASVLRGDRMCLCGILAAEHETLPEPMRSAVIGFFDENEAWLAGVLAQGHAERTLRFPGPASDAARSVLGALEGAMLVARPYGEIGRFESAAARTLASLAVEQGA
ncbi:MAG: TetR/AcrR family transcriptional regulator [Solirubrobacteraceae bacterium]